MQEVTYGILHFNPKQDDIARINYKKAVESLYKNRDNLSNPIYLIDQGNPYTEFDISAKLAEQYNLGLVKLPENIGIAAGINLISELSKTPFTSLVTSDVVFPQWCERTLLKELKENNKIAQICPLSDRSDIDYQRTPIEDKPPTICLAQELTIQYWRSEVFKKIKFYEPFRACYENLDFSLNLLKNGWYTAISNRVVCEHYHSGTMKSGARDLTYPEMNGSFDHGPLARIFKFLWPKIVFGDLYIPEKVDQLQIL